MFVVGAVIWKSESERKKEEKSKKAWRWSRKNSRRGLKCSGGIKRCRASLATSTTAMMSLLYTCKEDDSMVFSSSFGDKPMVMMRLYPNFHLPIIMCNVFERTTKLGYFCFIIIVHTKGMSTEFILFVTPTLQTTTFETPLIVIILYQHCDVKKRNGLSLDHSIVWYQRREGRRMYLSTCCAKSTSVKSSSCRSPCKCTAWML